MWPTGDYTSVKASKKGSNASMDFSAPCLHNGTW